MNGACGRGFRVPWHMCTGKRTTLKSWFHTSTFTWVLGIELKSPGLHDRHLYTATSQAHSPLLCVSFINGGMTLGPTPIKLPTW